MNAKTLGLKWVLLSVFLTVYRSDGQSPAPTSSTAANATSEFAVVSRSPNSRIWQKTVVETNFAGVVRTNTRSYTELRTGVCYQNPTTGAYEDSVENIELTQSGAAATQGAHKVAWNANANTPTGAVELTSPSGQKFSSTVYGLAYWDDSTGSNVLIAQLQDSGGAVAGANTVIYTNAFSQISADIEYIYTMGGLEQNIILREQPPSPTDFNLNPATTWFGVMTVFFNPPAAETRTITADGGSDDRLIRFSDMLMGQGTSFLDGIAPARGSFPVTKHWLPQENGNAVLVEEMPYTALTNLVGELPLHSSNAKPSGKVRRTASLQELFRHPSANTESGKAVKMGRMSANKAHRPGLVVDYTLTGYDYATSNFVFQSDTTYLIGGQWYYYGYPGTMFFEGGTVIKYTNSGTIFNCGTNRGVFEGSSYRPSIFTSWNDNSVGTTIPGSAGVAITPLTTCYVEEAGGGSSSNFIKNARFSYSDYAYTDYSDPTYTFQDCQFVNCTTATFTPYGRKVYFKNVLCVNCLDVFSSYGGPEIVDGENITADSCTNLGLASSWWGAATYGGGITNSILTACGATSSFTFDHSEMASSSSGIFQTVGAASYYLADGSPYRDSGTTNISAALLADLQGRTTYPPIVVQSGVFAENMTLYPQAQRDTDVPDMGYHYEPLDYALNGAVSNAVITVLPGTALATFGSSYGLWLYYNAVINCTGTATSPNYVVLYNTVQEQSNTNWETSTWVSSIYTPYSTDSSSAGFTFTDWSILGGIDYHIESDANPCPISLVNCQFAGGTILDNGPAISSTNCLYDRVAISMNQLSLENNFFNNLFHGGSLAYRYSNSIGDSWTFRDNLFDRTAITNLSGAGISVCSNNAYVTTNYGVVTPENHDVLLTNSPAYQTGALGIYYYQTNQTNLIYRGSELASAVGLYHYTLTTNNLVEGTNVVSIGFHYVACGTNGLPLDTDGDGIPDYLEDANGNGIVDAGETSWTNYNSPNGLTVPNGLVVFTPLR
jgi:hypothetical protein